jgi:methionyl-tRNA synthetase
MSKKQKFYITTAIVYTSARPHIGNTYEIILSDAIARYKRSKGFDVFFQTGTDEHGKKNEDKAKEVGKSPREYVDNIAAMIKDNWDLMNVSYDKFIRTTDADHKEQVRKIFKRMHDQGDIYKGFYEGLYCTPCESFYSESGSDEGKCPDCGRMMASAKEEAYFFKMSKYADRLIEHINTHPEFIQPESRKKEMMNNFLLPGLHDLCVSRTSFTWGVPVDFEPNHVVYVWLDALTNYITGIGYDCDGDSSRQFQELWPADIHVIGKDIVRFHTIYWPIFLMALDLPLPKTVLGHPWLLVGEGKMSKSKGNVIYAEELVEIFGVDALRYYVLREMHFDNDGSITWELMTERINADLVNTLGNLVNRTIAMINKYYGGVVTDKNIVEDVDLELKKVIQKTIEKVEERMDRFHVAEALGEIFTMLRRCNKYIDETTPWILAKEEDKKERLETVLYNLLEGIRVGATLLEPFITETSEKILKQIGDGKVTDKPEILFQRLDVKEVLKKVEELYPQAEAKEAMKAEESKGINETKEAKEAKIESEGIKMPTKEEITYDQFSAMQFQVGEVIACEEVKKSKKLLCSQVRIGDQVKQIVSGIKGHYTPKEMVGKKVMVVVNLKPAKLAGLLSEGMLLCAEGKEGELVLMIPEKDVHHGAVID